ncbi:response regulator transcription factor [Streptomyces sp. RY43-2]|uniref:Response regulator transcription factor n=1 Tax=Streptomyces macrolidinus TaxID=2952607 RepID=A0ABT0ZLF1_9ACTN|nr:response regulator transcription factor [Streptomyces macrolidinus]MCN9244417.1 response regulator transcription factor [Streptomyces macrolidinus]
MTATTVRVVLADDQELVRAGLRMVIDATPDIEVVGEAGTGAQAVRLVRELRPDVVVMDLRMPGMDGVEATQMIATDVPATRVVVLTTYDEDANIYAALRAGAGGFLVKDMALDDILTAVRVIARGDALLAPGITRRLIADFVACGGTRPDHAELPRITARERQVLALVGRGLSNAELAAHLHISPGTAKAHVASLLTKLGARDRVQLVILAYESGLVTVGEQRTGPPGAPGG